jgi:hypothetical protein
MSVKQKTRKIIEKPTSGSYGGQNELDKIWTTHAEGYVIGWDIEFVDAMSNTPANASDEDIELVYLWFILHHDDYEIGSGVPIKDPSDVPLKFQVRIFYPSYNGPEDPAKEPMKLVSQIYGIYNESDNISSVKQVWDHDQVDDCILMEGETVQSHMDTISKITPSEGHLLFENDSELE